MFPSLKLTAVVAFISLAPLAHSFVLPHPLNSFGKPVSHAVPRSNKFNHKHHHHLSSSYNPVAGLHKISNNNGFYNASRHQLSQLANSFGHISQISSRAPSSSKAATKLNGVVAVFSQQYGFMGYVGTAYTRFETLTFTQDTTQVLFTTVPSANPGNNFNLAAINMTAPFLAVIEGYSGPTWGAGLPGYGSLTVVQQSTYPASNTQNPTGLPSESNIWTVNLQTGQLTAVWFNNNGAQVPCTIFYDVTYGDLNFGGDLPAFVKQYGDTDVAVTMYFVGLW